MSTTIDNILDLIDNALASEAIATEAIHASTLVTSGSSDERAMLQAAEDLLEHAHTMRTVIDDFWARTQDWEWDENDIVHVRTGLRGSEAWKAI